MRPSSTSAGPAPALPNRHAAATGATPLTAYQRSLFGFLGLATFFEGYELFALAQVLPSLRADMGLSTTEAGALISVTSIGTVLSYLLVRRADRWGRRRVLLLAIVGYTVLSVGTALTTTLWTFAALQFAARVFLVTEYAIAMVYAAEEYPADRRGMVIGVLQACASLGSIACAGIVPVLLQTSLGWRSVYLVGAVPLVVVLLARGRIRETTRFARDAAVLAGGRTRFGNVLRTRYRARVLQLAVVWALTFACTLNAVTFWKEFAMSERGLTDAQVAGYLSFASIASMPLVFLSGRLLDAVGRRMGAVIIFIAAALGVAGSYTATSPAGLTLGLVLGIFGASAVMPVLNAFTAELFPTELRSEAYAWSNNLLARIASMGSPVAVGYAAGTFGWGPTLAVTAVFPLLALGVILVLLPETAGRELEDTAAM